MSDEKEAVNEVEETTVEEILAEYKDKPEAEAQDEGEDLITVEEA